ncbi:MAG: hypothetical protein VYA17_10280 [Pseudomonadota bacterium]|nr:hypothetical protein [Pseudomonadota bacterium]
MTNIFRVLFFALTIGSVCSLFATANAACVPGKGVVKTDAFEEVEEASDEDIAKAKKLARMNAWQRYVKTLDKEHSKAYSKDRSKILKGLPAFIEKMRIADEVFDEGEQTLSIEVCITVNTEMFKGALKVEPEIKSGEGIEIVGLFVARQAQTAKEFQARVKKDRSGENTEEADDKSKEKSQSMTKEIAQASGGKAVSGTFQKKKRRRRSKRTRRTSSKSESGGSTERRSEEIRYKIISAEPVNNAMNKVLSNAGYELADYDEIAADCDGPPREEIEDSFVTRDSLTSRHKIGAWKAALECEVPFFARGTMTADIARRHKSGLKIVYVRVRGEVREYQLKKKRKKRRSKRRRSRGKWNLVGAVDEQQYSGLGPNESVARTNALRKAGEAAAAQITKMLLRKGIK